MSKYGSSGRLVIPKNSKWSMATGICVITAFFVHMTLFSQNVFGIYSCLTVRSFFLYFVGISLDEMIVQRLAIILLYIPLIVVIFKPKQNINILLMLLFLTTGINLIFLISDFRITPFTLFYMLFRTSLPFLLFFIIKSGKVKNKRYMVLVCIIAVVLLRLSLSQVSTNFEPEIARGGSSLLFFKEFLGISIYLLFTLDLDTVPLCPNCGIPLTNAGKFCDNCGEQLTIK